MVHFIHCFNYAEGLSVAEGDAWYREAHVPRAREIPGVRSYLSWQALTLPFPLSAPAPFDQFARLSELSFASLEAARTAVTSDPALWARSEGRAPGFREFEGLFLAEEPQFNLLRDVPAQQYKYITLPMMWPNGVPSVDDTDDLVVDVYFFNYRPGVAIADGEDWYLGHHTREGKQLPGLKRYQTWQGLHLRSADDLPFQPNRWLRLTHLGFTSFDAFRQTLNGPQRVRFTPSPVGSVLGEWRNLFIRLEEAQDLLA